MLVAAAPSVFAPLVIDLTVENIEYLARAIAHQFANVEATASNTHDECLPKGLSRINTGKRAGTLRYAFNCDGKRRRKHIPCPVVGEAIKHIDNDGYEQSKCDEQAECGASDAEHNVSE